MSDDKRGSSQPGAVKEVGGRPAPGKPATTAPGKPRGLIGGVKASRATGHLCARCCLTSAAHLPESQCTIFVPRSLGRVQARQRPSALPVPADRRVSAFSPLPVLDRWGEEAAGIRPAALAQGDNIITMFDIIGEDWWSGGGITAKKVAAQLRAIGDRPVEVQINSPGGDMFEGLAIYNVLREHSQPVTIKVMGMAASAASIIAMAGDTIEIGAASFFMIHNCWVVAAGNQDDMREVADYLAPFDTAMADVYAQRTGQKAEDCAKWMRAETWLSGSLAIERGFADQLLPADQTKVDENAKAADRSGNEVRATEMALIGSGMTRTQARARIKNLKGTPGAALDTADTPGAGGFDDEWKAAAAALLDDFRR